MAKRTVISDSYGTPTRIVETSDDGRKTDVYAADNSIAGSLFNGGKGDLLEVVDHHPDGTSTAYEGDDSFIGLTFFGGRGDRK
jgi:hypothetical protein